MNKFTELSFCNTLILVLTSVYTRIKCIIQVSKYINVKLFSTKKLTLF